MRRDEFLYIAVNPSMPNLVKIGKTLDIKDRLNHLSRPTGVPEDFICIFLFKCINYSKKESIVHRHFQKVRLKKTREFFKLSPQEAIDFIKTLDGEVCDLKKYLYSIPIIKLPTKRMLAEDISQNKIKEVKKLLRHNYKQNEVVEMTKVSDYHVRRFAKEIRNSALQNKKRMA